MSIMSDARNVHSICPMKFIDLFIKTELITLIWIFDMSDQIMSILMVLRLKVTRKRLKGLQARYYCKYVTQEQANCNNRRRNRSNFDMCNTLIRQLIKYMFWTWMWIRVLQSTEWLKCLLWKYNDIVWLKNLIR